MYSIFPRKLVLNCPAEDEIFAAYQSLPATGAIDVSCGFRDVLRVCRALERAGFIGLRLRAGADLRRGLSVSAFKGKDGPCYDTGKLATYCGSALAALDDDHHLLFGKQPVCEKTAKIYQLSVYKKVVHLSEGDSALLERLSTHPAPFDCDTLEADATALKNALSARAESPAKQAAVLYPGPFKLLVLHNGAMLPRGEAALVSEAFADELVAKDACIVLDREIAIAAAEPQYFHTAFEQKGLLCLLENDLPLRHSDSTQIADFSALDEAPEAMRKRLQKMIGSGAEYFVMTGSDARNAEGCCPSDGVTAANRLVEAGILQVARSQSAPDACPVGVYAFAGEIATEQPHPSFRIDPAFRNRVRQQLSQPQTPKLQHWQTVLRWSLLLFVAFYLGFFFSKISNLGSGAGQGLSEQAFISALDLPEKTGIAVLQFHRSDRCTFCNNMEASTRAALKQMVSNASQAAVPPFRLINMDQPEMRLLIEKFQIFTSTIVFIEVQNGYISRHQIFTAAWDLTEKKQEFAVRFIESLTLFSQ